MPVRHSPTPSIEQRIELRRRKSELSLGAKLTAVSAVAVLILLVGALGAFLTRESQQSFVAVAAILSGTALAFVLLLFVGRIIRLDVSAREQNRARVEELNVVLESQAQALAEHHMKLAQHLEVSLAAAVELETSNKEVQRISAIAEDEREAAEVARDLYRMSDAKYRFLADTIPVQVWTAAPSGQLDFVSERVAEYFNRTREEVLGDGWLGVIHPDDVSPVVERWTHALLTGEPYDVTFRLRRYDGTYRWHLGRATALRSPDGEIVSWFGSNTDINDQQTATEGRERLLRSLERSNKELDQFAYVASHDLKAPLRGIANLSEWIEEDIGTAFPQHARDRMNLLRGRVRRLESLIEGLLEFSRAGRTGKPPAHINLTEFVTQVVELLAPPSSALVQVAPNLPALTSDPAPLQQVLSNLIGNAIKYSARPDAIIRVEAELQGPFARVRVSDNGPGIPPQYHERIFVLFQRLAARDKIEGTGIGLAIVKKLVEERGGRVWVESPTDMATGTGATFNFTWPQAPAVEPQLP